MGRWGKSSDLVGPRIFLASEASFCITVTDSLLMVTGQLKNCNL